MVFGRSDRRWSKCACVRPNRRSRGDMHVKTTPNATDFHRLPPREARAVERHFTVSEVADLWNLSHDAVRRIFRHEPGVLVIGDPNPSGKRGYVTLRIPHSILERVHRHFSSAVKLQK